MRKEPSEIKYPHCDQRVLHAPGECKYCDQYSDAQNERMAEGINFTGHQEPDLLPCPSDSARGLGGAHVWGGNRPHKIDEEI
jgi:hypothetical protein